MNAITQNFNREVIERTIDRLRANEKLSLSEDMLERLKSNWLKNL